MIKMVRGAFAVSVLAACAAPTHAFETFNIVLDPSNPYKINASITSPLITRNDQIAGQFLVTPTGGSTTTLAPYGAIAPNGPSFYSYCVELDQYLHNPADSSHQYEVKVATTQVTADRLGKIGQLYTLGLAWVGNDKSKSTALQTGIWELTYETDGLYNLTGGNAKFTSFTGTAGDLTQVQTWLTQISGSTAPASIYNMKVLASPYKQDYLVATAVPEPEAYGLALAGMGVVAFAMRRRKAGESA